MTAASQSGRHSKETELAARFIDFPRARSKQ
jgi:hypothetical protein